MHRGLLLLSLCAVLSDGTPSSSHPSVHGGAASHGSCEHTLARMRWCMSLRGGRKKLDPADRKEYEFASKAKLSPELEKDLRRHWKKKPKEILISAGGISKKIKSSTLVQLMRDRAREEQKRHMSLPMRLLDLGTKGLRWVRDVPGLWDRLLKTPTKWTALTPPTRQISADEAKTIELMEELFSLEDGYVIARAIKPRMVPQALDMPPPGKTGQKALMASTPVGSEGSKANVGGGQELNKVVGREMTVKEVQAMGKLVVNGQNAEKMPHVGSHTYGEISVKGFAEVLSAVAPLEDDVFVDLGSGTGKAVMLAAALYPVKKSRGIEYVKELHEAALRLDARFKRDVLPSLPLYQGGKRCAPSTSLHLADIKDADWADATILFAACTCWSSDLMRSLEKGCEKMPIGSRIVTMTQKPSLDSKHWELVKKIREWYGKGKLTWWVYKRIV